MATPFTFNGKTIWRPGILVRSTFGIQRAFQLLPFGTIMMAGVSDGGHGGGSVYLFDDIGVASQFLRGGPLLDALKAATNLGGYSGIVAIVVGLKTGATLGLSAAGAVAASGTVTVAGTSTTGQTNTITVGGFAVSAPQLTGNTPTQDAAALVAALNGSAPIAALVTANNALGVITLTAKTPGTVGNGITLAATTTGGDSLTTSGATLTGGTGGSAALNSGDQGAWTDNIKITIAAGTSDMAATFSWPAPDGTILTYGGVGTKFDRLQLFSDLASAIAADPVLTPAASTGDLPIVAMTVSTDGNLQTLSTTALAGGTGGTGQTLVFNDWKAGIDASIETPFDIGHLVGGYDAASQAYADAQAQQIYPLGRLRRFIHQVSTTATASNTMTQNSSALTTAGQTAAAALGSIRSSVCVQKLYNQDPTTGTNKWVDGAILAVGLAALKGATGAWGPATPLTYEYLPTVTDVDYPVMTTTGDVDACVRAGVFLFERVGRSGTPGSVRVLQSLTTAPNDGNGKPWAFSEFSVVRVSDALLANVKAAVEAAQPKAIGAGNTVGTRNAVLAQVTDVLELALDQQWITAYDPASVQIVQSGSSGSDDIVKYSAAPTLPLNHIGIDQTLIPFQTAAATGGVVNG